MHAKMAEERDLEKCNFRNFRSSVTLTLTLDRVEVKLMCISGQGLYLHTKLYRNRKTFCGRTDGQTWVPIY